MAVFSGDPKTEDDANSNRCHTFKGQAIAIIRAKTAGKIHVMVFGEGLAGKSIAVTAVEP